MSDQDLTYFQEQLGYHFKNPQLLREAFIHQSYINESPNKQLRSNERLEFLGDAVLELIVSHILFTDFPDIKEGDLTQKRIRIVCESSFAYLAKVWNLSSYLKMGRGAELQGESHKPSILADCFEAVCGAIYLDGGWDFLFHFFREIMPDLEKKEDQAQSLFHNYKSKIQEFCNEKSITLKYRLIDEKGPDHDKIYTTALFMDRKEISRGQGKNKKESEQMAAKKALEFLKSH